MGAWFPGGMKESGGDQFLLTLFRKVHKRFSSLKLLFQDWSVGVPTGSIHPEWMEEIGRNQTGEGFLQKEDPWAGADFHGYPFI